MDNSDRERWRVDLASNTATHDTGLVMHFERLPETPGTWDGLPINLECWRKQQGLSGVDLAQSLPRLVRLAGDAFILARKNAGNP